MEMKDITDWMSPLIKTIEITQDFGDTKYQLEVKRFIPAAGDSLEEVWCDAGVKKSQIISPYAIADMRKSVIVLEKFVNDSVATYVKNIIDPNDTLMWNTFAMACKHATVSVSYLNIYQL
jgi:hypothetical protein